LKGSLLSDYVLAVLSVSGMQNKSKKRKEEKQRPIGLVLGACWRR
jgi:hypothetical protein